VLINTVNFFSIIHVVLIQYVTIRQIVHAQSVYYSIPINYMVRLHETNFIRLRVSEI